MDIERIRSILLGEMDLEKEKQKMAGTKMQLFNVYDYDDQFEKDPEIETNEEPIEETDDEEPIEETDDDELADLCFKLDEIKMLTEIGLPIPSQITESEKSNLFDKAQKLMEKLGGKKGIQMKRGNTGAVNLLDEILNLIRVYMGLLKPTKDQTGGRYKQNRRNAYKIGSGGEYGTLVIHLPGLFKDHILEAFKDGNKVMKQPIDQDTIDLLTKRFNGSKNYSELSKKVFNQLNQLSQIPNHKSSKKMFIAPTNGFQFEEQKYKPNDEFQVENQTKEQPDDTDELLARLETLIGDFKDGLNFVYLQEEFIDIVNKLYYRGVINDSQKSQFFRKYL